MSPHICHGILLRCMSTFQELPPVPAAVRRQLLLTAGQAVTGQNEPVLLLLWASSWCKLWLTQVPKEEEVCEQPPYFSLLEYQMCVEVHIEWSDDLHRASTDIRCCTIARYAGAIWHYYDMLIPSYHQLTLWRPSQPGLFKHPCWQSTAAPACCLSPQGHKQLL